jgi:nucleoside-diphosphate-sugar epimerase
MIVAGPDAVPLCDMLRTLALLTNRRRCGPRLPLAPMLGLAALTEDLCTWLKISPPLYRRRMDFYTNDAAFDSTRARQVLGWKPKVSLVEGLARTLRSYEQPAAVASASNYLWLVKLVPFAAETFSQASVLLA